MKTKMKDLTIYSNGLCYCSVCTSMDDPKEIEAEVNRQNPTGLISRWKISKDLFNTGKKNPNVCNQNPETHKHYLLSC